MMVEPSYERTTAGNGGSSGISNTTSFGTSASGNTENRNNNDNVLTNPFVQFETMDNFTVDDLLSVGSAQQSSGGGDDQMMGDSTWHLHHPGVHMVVQENAKLPTFNLPINRSALRAPSETTTLPQTRNGGLERNTSSIWGGRSSKQNSAQRQSEGFAKRPPALPQAPDHTRLAEHFLTHSRGRHQNITFHRHALHNHPGAPTATDNPSTSKAEVDPLDALLAVDLQDVDMDPTPLSEIKLRHQTYQAQQQEENTPTDRNAGSQQVTPSTSGEDQKQQSKMQNQRQQQQPQTTASKSKQANHTQSRPQLQQKASSQTDARPQRVVGTHRTIPLPIPTKKISPPASPPGFQNSKQEGSNSASVENTTERSIPTHVGSASGRPTENTTKTPTIHPSKSGATTTISTSTSPNPRYSVGTGKGIMGNLKNYKNPAPSIHRASTQKTQYGFGTNHVVAAVPPVAPHRRRKVPDGATTANYQNNNNVQKLARTVVVPKPSAQILNNSLALANANAAAAAAAAAGTNQGAAYERKKQRAKDARVKLNESIERLSVAIGLAGTQSHERCEQWNALPMIGTGRQAALDICQECFGTAESAKKWDRPSFVGSAASLIQALNAQCEALMRELVTLHQQHESDLGRVFQPHEPKSNTKSKNGKTCEYLASHHKQETNVSTTNYQAEEGMVSTEEEDSSDASGHHQYKREVEGHEPGNFSSKRQRLNETMTTQHQTNQRPTKDVEIQWNSSLFSEQKIMMLIASFLEPTSLLRCLSVSRQFKSLEAFDNEQVWQGLAAARFGYFNVRQWHAKLDDDEEGIKASSTTLYQSMDRANVMPTFCHEGMFLLGEARLPNKVSAWTFLVERSNGETLRSIRRKPDMPGRGDYTSLPVIELRTIIQNTGASTSLIAIRDQTLTVDVSTRRRGEEMKEVDWDSRFQKRLENLDGTPFQSTIPVQRHHPNRTPDLAHLRLFESVVLVSFIYARGCSTNSKFVQRSNFSKILVGLNTGVTLPLVIPFPRDASHLQH